MRNTGLFLFVALIVGDAQDFLGVSDGVLVGFDDMGQGVRDLKVFVLRFGHAVVGQDLEAFDVAEAGSEAGEAIERNGVVRIAGNEHMAQPDRFPLLGKIPGEVENILIRRSCELLVFSLS